MQTGRRHFFSLATVTALSLASSTSAGAAPAREPAREPVTIVTADNPDPAKLPTLSVWWDESFGREKSMLMLTAAFPGVPGLVCDSWCYEGEMDFLGAKALTDGKLDLRHRVRAQPQVLIITTVLPEPGAVEFLARAELDRDRGGALPSDLPTPNLCWQLRRAANFKSRPEPYPEFIKRCFVFTEQGRTFLDQTTRRKIPVRAVEDLKNNPPWVQMYVGAWQDVPKAGTNSWADYSPDRYTTRVIGTVSRDGKYLAALANDSASLMSQAWHDCLHNNALWQPADAPPEKRAWRLKIYALENNPDLLLAHVNKDFAGAAPAIVPRSAKPD